MKKETSGSALYKRVRGILGSARAGVTRTVNTTRVIANWLIGREIVEEEQRGKRRAEYGGRVLQRIPTQRVGIQEAWQNPTRRVGNC